MQARKNVAGLTPPERQAFIDALIELKSRPSQRGLANRYDDYVRIHTDSMNVPFSWAHGGPAFTAWHRVLLHKFEGELRSIDSSVSIPFWDWTVDRTATSAPWFSDLLGGDGGPTNPAGSQSGEVGSGPLQHSAGDWDITTGDPGTNDDPFDRPYLARGFGRRGDAPQLPTSAAQTTALNQGVYSQFQFDLEVPLHNLVHRWVNGQMILRASPQDPVFWMHHCNIDRLWGIWMRGRPDAQRYTAAPGDPSFHQPNGTMVFHDAAVGPATPTWGGTFQPVDTIDDHAFGVWYEGDPPIITLETPAVTFQDVEVGHTTYAAVVFTVEAVETVSFELLSSVPSPFGLPPSMHPPAPVVSGLDAQTGRVWLSFSPTSTASVTPITVQIRCPQTGEVWDVPVTANAVPVRTASVTLVADRSGSMAQDAGNGLTKRDKLGQALGIVAGLTRDVDHLALISFDDQFDVVIPIDAAGAAGSGGTRDQLLAAATSPALDPRGLTGIGGGIQLGAAELAGATTDTVALVVITDGVENIPPTILQAAGSITSTTYAIGIGRPSDVNTDALTSICQGHDGYLLVTGDLAAEELFRLHKYFLQVHAGVTNQQIVTDPSSELTFGVEHRIPFSLCTADITADVMVACPVPEALTLVIESPDGTRFDGRQAATNVDPLTSPWLAGTRLSLPIDPSVKHGGTWTAVLSLDKKRMARLDDAIHLADIRERGAVPYSLVVSSRTDLRLRLATKHDREHAFISASLDAYGVEFSGRSAAVALVTGPEGRTERFKMESLGSGRHSLSLATPDAGLYTARVIVRGELDGAPFTREQIVSLATVTGKPTDSDGADRNVRRPRPSRRRPGPLGKLIKTARKPVPLPRPKPIDPEARARHRHGKGDTHFPSEDEVMRPEPWEDKGSGVDHNKDHKSD